MSKKCSQILEKIILFWVEVAISNSKILYKEPERWSFSFEFYVILSKLIAIYKVADTKKQYLKKKKKFLFFAM